MRKVLELGHDYAVLGDEELDCVFAEAIERNYKRAKADRKKREASRKARIAAARRKNKREDAIAFATYVGIMFLMLAVGVAFGLNIGGL